MVLGCTMRRCDGQAWRFQSYFSISWRLIPGNKFISLYMMALICESMYQQTWSTGSKSKCMIQITPFALREAVER